MARYRRQEKQGPDAPTWLVLLVVGGLLLGTALVTREGEFFGQYSAATLVFGSLGCERNARRSAPVRA